MGWLGLNRSREEARLDCQGDKRLCLFTASETGSPAANKVAIAEAKVHPVPWVFFVSILELLSS